MFRSSQSVPVGSSKKVTKKQKTRSKKVKKKKKRRTKDADHRELGNLTTTVNLLNASLSSRDQIFAQIPTVTVATPPPKPTTTTPTTTTSSSILTSSPPPAPPPPQAPSPSAIRVAVRIRAATAAAAVAAAAKVRTASRFTDTTKRTGATKLKSSKKKGAGHHHHSSHSSNSSNSSMNQHQFHYLTATKRFQYLKDLEDRLAATQSAVQRSTEEMQPTVDVLLQSVGVLEQTAEEQHRLDQETGNALNGLRVAVSLMKEEYSTKVATLETTFNQRLARMEERFQRERAKDTIAFTTLAQSHQAEVAKLQSQHSAFREFTKKRLDSLPSAISKLRAEAITLVEPLAKQLAVVSQAVGQLDETVFTIDREQLRIKLAMRNDDPATGSPIRSGFMNDSLDQSTTTSGTRSASESVVRRMQKDLRELVNEVARDRSTMRQRTDEQASKLLDLDGRMDLHTTTQQRANSELHELVARITSVTRHDFSDQLTLMSKDLNEKIARLNANNRTPVQLLDEATSAQQNADALLLQATVSRASVDANEALRYSREWQVKLGSMEAGLAARLTGLVRRVDILSSEVSVSRTLTS